MMYDKRRIFTLLIPLLSLGCLMEYDPTGPDDDAEDPSDATVRWETPLDMYLNGNLRVRPTADGGCVLLLTTDAMKLVRLVATGPDLPEGLSRISTA